MADTIDPKKDNKDAESGEPVQLDDDRQQGGRKPPKPGQGQGEQSESLPQQAGQQHEGGRKR